MKSNFSNNIKDFCKSIKAVVPIFAFLVFTIISPEIINAQRCGGPTGSCANPEFDPELIEGAVGMIFMLIEGAFGALIMVVAGLGAIIAAAMGAYRASLGMLVVALGAFILRALVSLFFGTNFHAITNT